MSKEDMGFVRGMKCVTILGWLMCGILAFGMTVGSMCHRFPDTKPRHHYGIAALMFVIGQAGLVVATISTRAGEDGFKYRGESCSPQDGAQ